jgi:hypothetical protein
MSDNWRNQAIPTEGWRSQAVPVTEETTPTLPVKYVGGKGGAVKTSQEHLINSTSVGRVLDAFGEGAAEGWGDEPIGFSPESEEVLRDIGLYRSGDDNLLTAPFRAFNEGLIRPLAAGVDSLFRLFPAASKGVATGLGQVGEELGLLDPNTKNMADPAHKGRFIASVDEFLQIGGLVAGGEATYMGTRINVPKAEKGLKSLKEAVEEPAAQKDISSSVLSPGSEIAVSTAKNPTDIVSAIRLGPDEVVIGKVGEEHKDVFNRALQERGMDFADQIEAMNDGQTIDAYGFYDTVEGRFLTDKEALQQAKEFGLTPPDSRAATRFISPEVVQQHERYLKSSGKPTDLVPAITMPGEKPVLGLPGEIHNDIFLRMAAERGDEFVAKYESMSSTELDATHNYVDIRTNKTLTDKEANAAAKDYGLEPSVGPWMPSPRLINQQKAFLETQANQPKSLGAAATPPDKLAAALPPQPEGISPKFVTPTGTIDTAKLNELQDVYGAIEEVAQANAGTAPLATRGEVSWAQTEQLAQTAGVLPSELVKRGIGEAWNAHQIDSAIGLLQQGAKELLEASRKARATGSDADILAAVEAFHKASLYNEAVTGIKSEAGRALNILKKHKQEAAEVQNLSEVLKKLGGNASMDEILDALKALDNADASAVNGFVNAVNKVGPTDMVLEYLYNAMLSSPVTHTANLIGNTLAALWEVPVSGLTGAIGATRAALGSKTALAGDRAFLGEAKARLYGMVQGAPEGLRLAWRAIKEEAPSSGVSKLDNGKTKTIPGVVGRAVRVPTTALMAADEVFKAMGYRASINAQAYRKAAKAGLTGDKFKQRVAELTQAPTKKMVEKAHNEADYITFTSELGKTGKTLQRAMSDHPILKFWLVPFFRTPVNLLKHPFQHSVLSIPTKAMRETLNGKHGAAAKDEAYARILLGTGVTSAAFMAAAMGKLTGAGPKDPAEKATWMLAGNQPYSIRIGDTWHSYARLEPFATLLGISADAAYIRERTEVDDAADLGTLLAYSAGQNILNKTWLKGITDIVEVMNEPNRYGEAYARNLINRLAVPAVVGQAARMDDPYLRDARTILDGLKTRVPGLSDEVYPKRDIFGNAIKREGALGPDVVSPIFVMQVNKDPVVQELMSLGIFPGKAEREIRGVELNEQQYDDYQLAAGRLLYQSYSQLVNTPGWQNIAPGIRMDILNKQLAATRERARTYVMFKHPDILKQSMENKYNHLTGAP